MLEDRDRRLDVEIDWQEAINSHGNAGAYRLLAQQIERDANLYLAHGDKERGEQLLADAAHRRYIADLLRDCGERDSEGSPQ